jgi:hypothetical protein
MILKFLSLIDSSVASCHSGGDVLSYAQGTFATCDISTVYETGGLFLTLYESCIYDFQVPLTYRFLNVRPPTTPML